MSRSDRLFARKLDYRAHIEHAIARAAVLHPQRALEWELERPFAPAWAALPERRQYHLRERDRGPRRRG